MYKQFHEKNDKISDTFYFAHAYYRTNYAHRSFLSDLMYS